MQVCRLTRVKEKQELYLNQMPYINALIRQGVKEKQELYLN